MRDIGLPLRLREFGILENAIPSLAERANTVQRLLTKNPRRIGMEDITKIYKDAF
jgi:alcohol dehydrogenase class IV